MSDDYDVSLDDGAVAAPVAPGKNVIADGRVRTVDRRVVGYVATGMFLVAVCYLFIIKQTRDSMTRVALAAPAIPLAASNQNLQLPAASPSPLTATPSPLPTLRPATPSPIVYAPQPVFEGGTGEAPTRTPSPEDIFADEERRRILEARRASTRVALDDNRSMPSQAVTDDGAVKTGTQAPDAPALTRSESATQAPHEQFLAQHNGAVGYLPVTSRYELTRGTVINARWLTALDSTLPGGVIKAMVTETVYDSRSHSIPVLVPGTILTGEGDAQAQAGEARYLCTFDRVELPAPDSRKFSLGSNNAAGPQGENGASVSTDTHAGREFGRAFLYAMLQAGVNAASRASTVVDLGSNLGQVVPQNTHVAPTFHQFVGAPLTIIVAHDLPLDRFQENP